MKPGSILVMAILAPSLFGFAQDKAPAAQDAAKPAVQDTAKPAAPDAAKVAAGRQLCDRRVRCACRERIQRADAVEQHTCPA